MKTVTTRLSLLLKAIFSCLIESLVIASVSSVVVSVVKFVANENAANRSVSLNSPRLTRRPFLRDVNTDLISYIKLLPHLPIDLTKTHRARVDVSASVAFAPRWNRIETLSKESNNRTRVKRGNKIRPVSLRVGICARFSDCCSEDVESGFATFFISSYK